MRCTRAIRRPGRLGITLIEMMLVLALLVLIAALTIPAIESSLQFERLRGGADRVRSLMGKARVRAMKSGRIHAMWITPQGNTYRVEPWITSDALDEASQPLTQSGQGGVGQVIDPNVLLVEEQLPDGITFYTAQTLQDNRAMMSQQQVGALPGAGSGGNPNGVPPILFYTDGTTSTARLSVTNGKGLYVMILLRGMTGIAQTSQPLTAQEMSVQ